jgi:hypothetical protein
MRKNMTELRLDAADSVANATQLLLIDLTNGYNTKPRNLHRANLVEDCLAALFHFRTVVQQDDSQ